MSGQDFECAANRLTRASRLPAAPSARALHGAVVIIAGSIGPDDQAPENGACLRMLVMVLGRERVVRIAGHLFPAIPAAIDPQTSEPWRPACNSVVHTGSLPLHFTTFCAFLYQATASQPPHCSIRTLMQNNARDRLAQGHSGLDQEIERSYPALPSTIALRRSRRMTRPWDIGSRCDREEASPGCLPR